MSMNPRKNVSPNGSPKNGKSVRHAFSLHRLRRIRCQEGLSQRTVARHLGLTLTDVKLQELETTDIPLSTLYRWREVLNVPLAELLQEPKHALSPGIMERAQLVRVMKTVKYLSEQAKETSVKRMALTLIEQLVEIMPELRDVDSWHIVGRRRRRDDYGRAAEYCLPDEMFMDYGE